MVTLVNRHKNGKFEYTDGTISVNGYFDASNENKLLSINATYSDDIGNVNVYQKLEDGTLQYGVNSSSLEKILIITNSIETIWNEVSESIKDSEEQEEEQTEQVQSKKK